MPLIGVIREFEPFAINVEVLADLVEHRADRLARCVVVRREVIGQGKDGFAVDQPLTAELADEPVHPPVNPTFDVVLDWALSLGAKPVEHGGFRIAKAEVCFDVPTAIVRRSVAQ